MLTYPDPDLTDGVVWLRRWDAGDVGCVREASADKAIPEGTTVPAAFTEEAGLAFITRQLARAEQGEGLSLAIADAATGLAQGLVWLGVRPQPGVVGIGYWVVPAARGRGLAGRAVRLATGWSLLQGVARVEAWVEPDNEASQHVLQAAGFTATECFARSWLLRLAAPMPLCSRVSRPTSRHRRPTATGLIRAATAVGEQLALSGVAAARVEPVADVGGVAGLVGEVVELELHKHQQAVQPVAVAQDVAPRCELVADLVEPTVQAGRADDVAALALPLGGAAFELRADCRPSG